MSHRALVVHRSPGRMRIRISHAKRNPRELQRIKEAISSVPGVKRVDVNTPIGTIVVRYDPRQSPELEESLRKQGSETGAFVLLPPELEDVEGVTRAIEQEGEFLAQHSTTARAMVDAVSAVNIELKRATNGAVDLKVLVPLSLATYSFLHRKSSMATPLWITLGLFSFNAFIALHAPTAPSAARQIAADRSAVGAASGSEPKRNSRRRSTAKPR